MMIPYEDQVRLRFFLTTTTVDPSLFRKISWFFFFDDHFLESFFLAYILFILFALIKVVVYSCTSPKLQPSALLT